MAYTLEEMCVKQIYIELQVRLAEKNNYNYIITLLSKKKKQYSKKSRFLTKIMKQTVFLYGICRKLAIMQ